MGRSYYYLIAGLPDLLIDNENKGFNLDRLKDEVREQIHSSDWKLLSEIFRPYDIENFLFMRSVSGVRYNQLGNFKEEELFEAVEHMQLPNFMLTYIHSTLPKEDDEATDERAKFTPEAYLWTLFYEAMEQSTNLFLKRWYSFDRDFRNILAALACRKQNKEIAPALIGGGELVELLSKSSAPDFGIKREVDYLERILQIVEQSNTIDREKRLDLLRWQFAEEISVYDYFNLNWLMAFFIKATIVTRWLSLDRKHGEELFHNLVNELKSSFELSSRLKQ